MSLISTQIAPVGAIGGLTIRVYPFTVLASTGLVSCGGGDVSVTNNTVGYIIADKTTGIPAYTTSAGTANKIYLARVGATAGTASVITYIDNAPYDADGGGSGSGTKPATDVAYASSITPDINSYGIFNVGTLTGNITINAPTGTPTDGQTTTFRFTQNGTGGWTYTWNSAFAFGTDVVAADLPTTASASFEVLFRYNTAAAKWRCVGLIRGF